MLGQPTKQRFIPRETRMNTSTAIRTSLALGLGLTLATAASPAQAADFTVTFPAGVARPLFDLTVTGTGGNAEERVTQDHAGRPVRVISAGTGSALVFTNESTQESSPALQRCRHPHHPGRERHQHRLSPGAHGRHPVPHRPAAGTDDHPVHRQRHVHDDGRSDVHAAG